MSCSHECEIHILKRVSITDNKCYRERRFRELRGPMIMKWGSMEKDPNYDSHSGNGKQAMAGRETGE